MRAQGITIKSISDGKNLNLLFVKEITVKNKTEINLRMAAADYYKVIVNGETVFFGPARTAKGYAVENDFSVKLSSGRNVLAILLSSYGVACYSNVEQPPFFKITAKINGETITERDFDCYLYKERVKNVQRYSFQRGFSEIYKIENGGDIADKYLKDGKKIETEICETPKLLKEIFPLTAPKKTVKAKSFANGKFTTDLSLPDWKDRSIYLVGNSFDGFNKSELYECMTEKVCRFSFTENGEDTNGLLKSGEYADYDLKRNVAGFITFSLNVKEKANIYVTFDEMLSKKANGIDPVRLDCCNVIKWELGAGEYKLESSEPYTARYIRVIVESGEVENVSVGMRLLENADVYRMIAKTSDRTVNAIISAAQNTLAQNSFDLLMDCPSRERAGWLNDQYYSGKAARLFTGNDDILESSVLAEILDPGIKEIRKGMTPMCYPSEHINGEYIPNCCLWFALNVCELIERKRLSEYLPQAKRKVYEILKAFAPFENEDGLLEDLESWVFVEWSVAGSKEYRKGVNYPTNMLYYKTLKEAAKAFGDNDLNAKAKKVKRKIIEQSFDGTFFQDNRIRENGILTLKNHISETCQYFAFFSGVADCENFSSLIKTMIEKFGVNRKKSCYPQIGGSNIITGMLMRLDILCDSGEYEKAVTETKKIFGVMARLTGTLWEHLSPQASCDHAIASFAGYILVRALTGYKDVAGMPISFSDDFYKKCDCSFRIPSGDKTISVTVLNSKRYL